MATDAASVAQAFHEAYERLAPNHGYRTREASAKPWSEVPEQNKGLMVAVVAELLDGGVIAIANAPKPPPDTSWLDAPPQASITRRGRWLYGVNIHWGGMCNHADWTCFGRRHAQSKARRALAKHLRRRAWEANPTIIKAGRHE